MNVSDFTKCVSTKHPDALAALFMNQLQIIVNQGCQIWHPNCVRLAPNATNLGPFKNCFSTFWLPEPKCTETDQKKSQIRHILANLTQFGCQI